MKRACLAFLLSSLTTIDAGAEEFHWNMRGWLSGIVASGTRQLDNRNFAGGARLHTELKFDYSDFKGKVSAETPTAYSLGNLTYTTIIREAWLSYSSDFLDVTAGRQILPQGHSDRIYPQDQFVPRDLTQLSVLDAEQQIGLPALRLDAYLNEDLTVTTALIVQDRGHVLPKQLADLLPSWQRLEDNPILAAMGRTEWHKDDFDTAISFRYGANPFPIIRFDGQSAIQSAITESPLEMRLAVDGSMNFAGSILRWDIVLNSTEVNNAPGKARQGIVAVVGLDKGLWADANLSLQVIQKSVGNRVPVNPGSPFALYSGGINHWLAQEFYDNQTWFTANLKQTFGDAHETELGMLTGNHGEFAVTFHYTWRFTDKWQATLFAEGLYGATETLTGSLRRNTLAMTEIRYQF